MRPNSRKAIHHAQERIGSVLAGLGPVRAFPRDEHKPEALQAWASMCIDDLKEALDSLREALAESDEGSIIERGD